MDLVSATSAAKKIGVPQSTFSDWIRSGRVPGAIKVSNMWLVPADITLEEIDQPKMGRPPKTTDEEAGDEEA